MILMDCRIIFRFSTSISKDQTLMDILNYNCRVCITSSFNFNNKLKTLAMSVPALLPLLVSKCRWRSCRSRCTSRPSPCQCRRHLVSSDGLGPVRGKQALFGQAAGANRTQTVSCEPDGGVCSRDGDDVSCLKSWSWHPRKIFTASSTNQQQDTVFCWVQNIAIPLNVFGRQV